MTYLDELKANYRRLRDEMQVTKPTSRRGRYLSKQLAEMRGAAKVAKRLDDAMREKANA